MRLVRKQILLAPALLLSACASLPTGPSVMVLPGSAKSFEAFQLDDGQCRGWAGQQTGVDPERVARQRAARGAVVGSALGAAAGALIGAASHDAGPGALIGAGAGLVLGTAGGGARGQWAGMEVQRRYDIAYTQCMYAKGNRVPVPSGFVSEDSRSSPPPPRRGMRRGRMPLPPPDAD